jgi:hypothetical protein
VCEIGIVGKVAVENGGGGKKRNVKGRLWKRKKQRNEWRVDRWCVRRR